MRILAFDPSGNWGKEGMGTTGFCVLDVYQKDHIIYLGELKATDFKKQETYWQAHIDLIHIHEPNYIVIEGYKLYHHRGQKAEVQAHSELPTPQLIGVIRFESWLKGVPYTIQFASDVKTRWNDDLLVRQGFLDKKGNRYYFEGETVSKHKRDALRHALHFRKYKLKEDAQ